MKPQPKPGNDKLLPILKTLADYRVAISVYLLLILANLPGLMEHGSPDNAFAVGFLLCAIMNTMIDRRKDKQFDDLVNTAGELADDYRSFVHSATNKVAALRLKMSELERELSDLRDEQHRQQHSSKS